MKKEKRTKLPPIFKISMLWNILPYYDYLHKWKILLEQLNKGIKDIWELNKKELIYIGREFKRDYIITEKDHANVLMNIKIVKRRWLELFSISMSDPYPREEQIVIIAFINQLVEDEAVIIDYHENLITNYKIQYWPKESISNIVPSILCPSFKKKSKRFENSEKDKLLEYINKETRIKSVIIERNKEDFSWFSVFSQILKLTWGKYYNETI